MIEKFVKLINYLKSVPGVSDVDFSIKDPMTIEFKHTSQEFINNFCCLFDDRDIFNEGDISYTKNENHIFVKFNIFFVINWFTLGSPEQNDRVLAALTARRAAA